MKTCNTCANYAAGRTRMDDVCMAPEHMRDDLVRGGRYAIIRFCDTARQMMPDSYCGAGGRFWRDAAGEKVAA